MTAFFIAGTDTGVGKTVITGTLAKALQEKGQSVVTQKWIQSGLEPDGTTDLDLHDQHYTPPSNVSQLDRCPYVFPDPASPHLSAELSNAAIDKNTLFQASDRLRAAGHTVLIEGSGGLMVPYTPKDLMIDLLNEYKIPTLLVSANKLGTLNHTLLSIEALESRNIPILGVLMNNGAPGCSETTDTIQKDNLQTLKSILSYPTTELNGPSEISEELQHIFL